MDYLETFFILSVVVQLAHSIEELSTGFHKKWYLFKMPFLAFLSFEIVFSALWIVILFTPSFPYRQVFQAFFLMLMFANGIQHLVWWGCVKKYMPGLITAFLHLAVFVIYYFKTIL